MTRAADDGARGLCRDAPPAGGARTRRPFASRSEPAPRPTGPGAVLSAEPGAHPRGCSGGRAGQQAQTERQHVVVDPAGQAGPQPGDARHSEVAEAVPEPFAAKSGEDGCRDGEATAHCAKRIATGERCAFHPPARSSAGGPREVVRGREGRGRMRARA